MRLKILAVIALTVSLSVAAYAIPPGWVKCKHYDGTIILIRGNSCPGLGWIRVYS